MENPLFTVSISQECSSLLSITQDSSDYFAEAIVDVVASSLDEFAPVSKRKTKNKKRSNFVYSKEVDHAKRIRRQSERQYRKAPTEIHKQLLKTQINKVRNLGLKCRARLVR